MNILIKNKSFGKKVVFDNASISIENQCKVAIIGANGSGKTTFFKVITNLYIDDIKADVDLKNNTHFAFDTPPSLSNISISKYLDFFSSLFDTPLSQRDKKEIISNLKIECTPKQKVSALSYGQKKMLYLYSIIFFGYYKILILDEPFNGLDYRNINILKK